MNMRIVEERIISGIKNTIEFHENLGGEKPLLNSEKN